MGRIRVIGERDQKRAAIDPDLGALADPKIGGRLEKGSVKAAKVETTRAATSLTTLEGLKPDTIVEISLGGGARFWVRYDQLAEDLPAASTRGAAGEPDTIDLPLSFGGSVTRGGPAMPDIEAVRAFDIDIAGLLGDVGGKLAGPELARRFDDWRMETTGLGRWLVTSENAAVTAPVKADELGGKEPILLLLHGTASSAEGSFGNLKRPASTPDERWRDDAWLKLTRAYDQRIVAYEHKTLSVSPIANAIDLMAALPDNALLHVVSHSRGGMIGELLCRGERVDGQAPFAGELEVLKHWIDRKGEVYAQDLAKLEELERLLTDKKVRVERFVRVACPAAGTTLAGERLDRWLSVTTSLLDLTGLGGSFTYRAIKGFLLAAVKTRTDPQVVPGLEAMLPGSLLTAVLNRPGIQVASDLSVISGDIEGDSWLGRLALKVGDWFYGGDHDLVVDTVAMYGGLARKDDARFFFDKGGAVSHFNYFTNRRTIDPLLAGLRNEDREQAGFVKLERPQEIDRRVYGRREGAKRPTVFILPGLMGSHLAVADDRVWIDLPDIAWGRLGELAINQPGVKAEALVAQAYGGLIQHLSETHEVVPHPYDWRRSLRDEALILADRLAERLTSTGEPVRIVGHSAGGLLALTAFALRPQLWRDFTAKPGCRLLLLGTPCRGSLAAARALLAQERLIAYLALLDIQRNEEELLEIISAFPGFLELLPADGPLDLLASATWDRLKRAKPNGWALPAPETLDEARKTRTLLDGFTLDRQRVLYVAGAAPATPISLEIGEGSVRFLATARGDGRVPWDTIPADLERWYADVEHGELAAHATSFPGYAELLLNGTTSLLSRTPPVTARASAAPFELPPDRPPVFPNEEELTAAALGYRMKPPRLEARKVRLRLIHGNLAFARHPVMVGHYVGDTIAGSEGHLDRALTGRLSTRRKLRLYPGEIGTAEIVLDRTVSPPGAVVVGLGPVGELAPGELRRAVAYGLRRYGLAVSEAGAVARGTAGISLLLIGAGEGGVSIRDSVASSLEAILQAKLALGEDALAEVELIELYEDRAIQAARAIRVALKEERLGTHLMFEPAVQSGQGGRRRAAVMEDPDWWRRRQVTMDDAGALHFLDLTDRARAEASLVAEQRELVDRFVRRAVTRPTRAGTGDDPGATLFELMFPPRLKDEARGDRHLVLVLNEKAAGYPWELLHDGGRGETDPPAVRAGLIRQLVEHRFVEQPVMATENKALVVGDPPSGMPEFPALDGAKAEAESVAQRLTAGSFRVTERVRSDPDAIVSALMGDRWRVLHLAGHGDVDFPSRNGPVTGMVLGDCLFLKPATIAQLPAVPEFVFINCCHLGRVNEEAERRTEARYPELAANLATAFIKLGARAVVAAGWAVDDAAAGLFANTLYDQLLSGIAFGRAVQVARSTVFRAYGQTNTWGAYQCYGDPAYRLVTDRDEPDGAASEEKYAHLREAVLAFENIGQDAQTSAVRDPDELRRQLELAWARTPAKLQTHPEILSCFGATCGELGDLERAIDCYTKALAAEKAAAPVRTIEQLANLRARQAAIAGGDGAKATVEAAITMVESLIAVIGGEPTVERLSLLGSCYKRLAQVSDGRERDRALVEMAKHYGQAHDRAEKNGRVNPYPLLNWLLALELRAVRNPQLQGAPDVESWLKRAEAEAVLADAGEPEFWNAITLADVLLGRSLTSGEVLEPECQKAVIEAYLRPWKRGTSPLKFLSVLEQLDFVAEVLTGDRPAASKETRATLVTALRFIAGRLRAATSAR